MTKEEKAVKNLVKPWAGRVAKDWLDDITQQAWLLVLEYSEKYPNLDHKEIYKGCRKTLNRWYNTKALPTVEKVKTVTTNQDEDGNTEEKDVVFVDIEQFLEGGADMPQSLITNDGEDATDTLRKLLDEVDLSFKEDVVIRLSLAGKRQDEIAEAIEVNQSRVSQLYNQAVAKIQQHIRSKKFIWRQP